MKKLLLLFFVCCVPHITVYAQDTLRLSLSTLLYQVETNYPAILQYQQNEQSWQEKAKGAKAWMAPTFSTGLMRFPYNFSMISEKNNPMNQAGIAFSLEQMIPNSGKLNAKRDYISSLAETEKSKGEWTKNELRREAKLLYFNRYVNQKKQGVLKDNEELLQILIKSAESKFSNNQSQLQTIFKAKARLAELNNMQLMLESRIAESNIGLNILMVRNVYTSFEIEQTISPKNYTNVLTDTSRVSNRSDITALKNFIQSMKLEQKVMKVGVQPDFGVRAEHMQMFGMPSQWSVMGMMTIPIVPWSAKMYTSEVQSINHQIQAMELEKQTMQLMASKMMNEKLSMLKYEYAQYSSYSQNILPAYENNLQANLLAYRQNTGDFFVLLDAWEMLLMKKMEAYDKLFTILKLEAEYEYELEIK